MANRKYCKKSLGENIFDVFNHIFMVVLCVTIIYPFWNIILLSFSTVSEAQTLGIHLWNKVWVADAYNYLLISDDIFTAYRNSIFRTVVSTVLNIITALIGAYPLSKRDLPGRNAVTFFLIIPIFFSGGLIPYYMIIRGLGLVNSMWVYVIPSMVGITYILLTRNFIMSLDTALEEAAIIDGAGYITILFKIIMPLCKPVLATIALWTMVSQWNAWFDSLLFITDDKKIVLQLLIQRMLRLSEEMSQDITIFKDMMASRGGGVEIFSSNIRAAAVIITLGPIVLAYPFLQKYFVKGIMIGSLKG